MFKNSTEILSKLGDVSDDSNVRHFVMQLIIFYDKKITDLELKLNSQNPFLETKEFKELFALYGLLNISNDKYFNRDNIIKIMNEIFFNFN